MEMFGLQKTCYRKVFPISYPFFFILLFYCVFFILVFLRASHFVDRFMNRLLLTVLGSIRSSSLLWIHRWIGLQILLGLTGRNFIGRSRADFEQLSI
uniref:Uncharacterized protein n=1 Tax=Heterorhabditis bacteriophora TaxID=37862 RepID=A0A1I7WQK3_HETBA